MRIFHYLCKVSLRVVFLNVLGVMPHPENLIEDLVGGTDGLPLFESLVESLGRAA